MRNFIRIAVSVIFISIIGFYFYWTNTDNDMRNYDALVREIHDGYVNYDSEVGVLRYNFSDEDILIEAINDARSDIYYADEGVRYEVNGLGITRVFLEYDCMEDGTLNKGECDLMQAETNAAIDDFFSDIDLNQPQSLVALDIHDKLIEMVDYDYDRYLEGTLSDADYTAYGALVNKAAVCDGYSKAYMVLLARAGIESYYVGSEAMNHSWVIARIDGKYYHIDITWDDPVSLYGNSYIDTLSHDYFMLSDEEISKDHYGYPGDLPKCE